MTVSRSASISTIEFPVLEYIKVFLKQKAVLIQASGTGTAGLKFTFTNSKCKKESFLKYSFGHC